MRKLLENEKPLKPSEELVVTSIMPLIFTKMSLKVAQLQKCHSRPKMLAQSLE